jgi:(p)ppGpp synthase/HD superfamily hydrolase
MAISTEDKVLLHLLEVAIRIAVTAHAGVMDKAGVPYILHPLRIMGGAKTVKEKIVGVLHDTVEDTDEWSLLNVTLDYLRDEGFPEEIIEAVDSVTHRKDESYEDYIQRAKKNVIGRKIKILDLRDNSDIFRLHDVQEKHLRQMKRYHAAMMELRKDGKVYITR